MKTQVRDNGWDEIITKKINILKPIPTKVFSTVGEWVVFQNKRPSLNKKGRNHCECCSVKWNESSPNMATYLVFTDKGNKIICENCYQKFKP